MLEDGPSATPTRFWSADGVISRSVVVMDAGNEDNVPGCATTATVISAANAPAVSTPSGPSPSRPGFTCTRWWMRTEARCCTVIPRSAPKRRRGSPDASPSASRASCGSSTRGCRGPGAARLTIDANGTVGRSPVHRLPFTIPRSATSTPAQNSCGASPCSAGSSRVPLKSELGLRPIFHKTQNRSDGHLFITASPTNWSRAGASPNTERTPHVSAGELQERTGAAAAAGTR